MISAPSDNPFPGLRPFGRSDHDFFFGRSRQIRDLRAKLSEHRFTAVVGRSGDGKSSLVKAGLIPELEKEEDEDGRPRWIIEEMTPQGSPLRQLALIINRLSSRFLPEGFLPNDEFGLRRSLAVLRYSSSGLVELLDEVLHDQPEKPVLLLVDQFEEIFNFNEAAEHPEKFEEAAVFVDLILRSCQSATCPIHVILTMRSDYLGDTPRFHGLPEAMNDSQFLVPRLTRQERREVIEKPIHKKDATIAPALTQRLLNDAGDFADMLPVLQHALMRTWQIASEDWKDGDKRIVQLKHYEAAKEVSGALNEHADEVLRSLSNEQRDIARKLFMALVDFNADGREVRRIPYPRIDSLAAICGTSSEMICDVINTFNAHGRNFLMPPAGTELKDDIVVYVSHEALFRQWDKFQTWLKAEREAGRIWHAMTQVLPEPGEKIRAVTGQLAKDWIDWFESNLPLPAWTERYGGRFDDVEFMIMASKKHRRNERRRRLMFVFGAGVLVLVAAVPIALSQMDNARERREQAELKRNEVARRNSSDLAKVILNVSRRGFRESLVGPKRLSVHRQNPELSRRHDLTMSQRLALTALLEDDELVPKTPELRAAARSAFGRSAITLDLRSGFGPSDPGSFAYSLAIAPDHERLFEIAAALLPDGSSTAGPVSAYEVHTGQPIRRELAGKKVRAIATATSAIAIANPEGMIEIVDPKTLEPKGNVRFPDSSNLKGLQLQFSADGSKLAAMVPGTGLFVWQTSEINGTEAAQPAHQIPTVILMTAFALAPDGDRIATATSDRKIRIRNFGNDTAAEFQVDYVPLALSFSPDGLKLALGGNQSGAQILDLAKGEMEQVSNHNETVLDVAFSPENDNILAAATANGPVRIYYLNRPKSSDRNLANRREDHKTDSAVDLVFSANGRHLAAVYTDGTIRHWYVSPGINRKVYRNRNDETPPAWVKALMHAGQSPDRLAAYKSDGKHIFEFETDDRDRRRIRIDDAPGTEDTSSTGIALLTSKTDFEGFRGAVFERNRSRLLTLDRFLSIWEWYDPVAPEAPGFVEKLAAGLLGSSIEEKQQAIQALRSPVASFWAPGGSSIHTLAFSPDGQQVGLAGKTSISRSTGPDFAIIYDLVSTPSELMTFARKIGVKPIDRPTMCKIVWPNLSPCPVMPAEEK